MLKTFDKSLHHPVLFSLHDLHTEVGYICLFIMQFAGNYNRAWGYMCNLALCSYCFYFDNRILILITCKSCLRKAKESTETQLEEYLTRFSQRNTQKKLWRSQLNVFWHGTCGLFQLKFTVSGLTFILIFAVHLSFFSCKQAMNFCINYFCCRKRINDWRSW